MEQRAINADWIAKKLRFALRSASSLVDTVKAAPLAMLTDHPAADRGR